MSPQALIHWATAKQTTASQSNGEMAELSILLPGRQLDALEAAAQGRGLTAGQLVRLIIRDYLDDAT